MGNSQELRKFLAAAWKDYALLTPDAPRIQDLLSKRGEVLVNDHIAFRTFDIQGIRRGDLGAIFENWGYKRSPQDLDFPEKRLKASYWLHDDPSLPKVFVSELLLNSFSAELQHWVRSFAEPAAGKIGKLESAHLLEANWGPVRYEDYERFYAESEYAAWTAAFGLRVNHFTVLVNSLKTFEALAELNDFLKDYGFVLNTAGGEVKGTPLEMLEQSSTLARKIDWAFAGDVKKSVMGCYYEFARRYPLPGGQQLFSGFVPKSADKIFESNFEKR